MILLGETALEELMFVEGKKYLLFPTNTIEEMKPMSILSWKSMQIVVLDTIPVVHKFSS